MQLPLLGNACFFYCVETFSNRVWSRTVSRILSVSALAWPFGVITGKCVQLNSISDLLAGYKKRLLYRGSGCGSCRVKPSSWEDRRV